MIIFNRKSYEGREINVVEFGDSNDPAILVDCGIHAREWAAISFW